MKPFGEFLTILLGEKANKQISQHTAGAEKMLAIIIWEIFAFPELLTWPEH